MASPKIVSCLTVTANEATYVAVPANPGYTLCAWSEQTEQPQRVVTGKRAITLGTGKWRVAVYVGEPDPIEEKEFFTTEPFNEPGFTCELGPGATFMQPPSSEPWPV